jgi:hypothetical protein
MKNADFKRICNVAYTMFIRKLSQNMDHAMNLSHRSINQSQPMFLGSDAHLKEIARLANHYAFRLLEIQRVKHAVEMKALKNEMSNKR